MVNNDNSTCDMMYDVIRASFGLGAGESAGPFSIAMKYYNDQTADIAIANVMREQKREEWLKRHPKKVAEKTPREKRPPVDAKKVLSSEHKKIRINKAEWIYRRMLREIERGNNERTDEEGGRPDTL